MARRNISLLAVIALVVTALTAFSGTTASNAAQMIPDKDCGDFNSQKAAQDFFLDHGGPSSDPHNLDADGDGVACESNPCPCSTDQGGGGGNDDGGGHQPPPIKVQHAKIVRVIDGDTMLVDLRKGPKVSVRLLGIDTPEVFNGKECWGPQASRFAKKILPKGRHVVLRSDRSQPLKDRYDRLLRYMKFRKYDIGHVQLAAGNAKVYVVGKRFAKFGAYKSAAKGARQQRRGVWKHC